MDKPSSKQRSIEHTSDASDRVEKSKVAMMQLQLLPHDVLCDILSRLSIKQVVRMSILSREWRQLRICHPDLVFTKHTFGARTATTNKDQESMAAEFIANVDSVLRPLWSTPTTTNTSLDKFAVSFGLRREHKYYLDKWITFSIASRAKHIALDFDVDVTCFGPSFDKYKYVVPLSSLSGPNGSCLRSLDLGCVCLKLPIGFCGITNLKKLTLNTVSISGDDLGCLLLSCAVLESASIEWCSSFSSLRIPQELCRLQDLRVGDSELEMIELHAPNLTKFEFDDCLKQVVLVACLKLSEATFVSNMRSCSFVDYGSGFTFTALPTALPHVQKLFLLLNIDQVPRFSDNQSRFISLRQLNMNLDFFSDPRDTSWAVGLVNLLQLAPLLEELELHLSHDRFYPPAMRTATAMQGPLHHHLNSVHMSGFCDALGLAELALYILGNATALKRMVVDPVAYADPLTDDIYSVSKAGSIEGNWSHFRQNRMFAEKNLDMEEFRQILAIL